LKACNITKSTAESGEAQDEPVMRDGLKFDLRYLAI
jgi:hypothetical protein